MDIQGQFDLQGKGYEHTEDLLLEVPIPFLLQDPVVEAHLADRKQLLAIVPDKVDHLQGPLEIRTGGI